MPVAVAAILAVHAPTAAQVARELAREARRCSGKLTLTGEGLGAVRVGASEAQVRRVCHVRKAKSKKGEAAPPPNLLTFNIGKTPVQAEIQHGRVWRVSVEGPAFKTRGKVGVDSPLSALLASGQTRASQTEGVIYASSSADCGLSFALSHHPGPGEDRDSWTADGLARLPPDTKLERALISGCGR